MTAERRRLEEQRTGVKNWRRWGPYLAERQWGTVREDYSSDGDAWHDFTFEQSRSRAYRWGEDGLAGVCDWRGQLNLALALWNGRDPILKERLFGLTNGEGNHGEDVKELYYYLDATPTHSYLKYLYKYPQAAFPYQRLRDESRGRGRCDPEFELLDTGLFDADRYFDVFVEYAKATPNDVLMRITAHNRGPDPSTLHVLPHLWFRNTWSWEAGSPKPIIQSRPDGRLVAQHERLKMFHLASEPAAETLFCENETNRRRLYGARAVGHFKDAFHDAVVNGNRRAVNPKGEGTKSALHYVFEVPSGESRSVRLRLSRVDHAEPLSDFEEVMDQRCRESDSFYAEIQAGMTGEDARRVQRQALAGMIWSKQFYFFDVPQWLSGDPAQPPPPGDRKHGRNHDWWHLNTGDVLSMPDKWEYPWFAAWDLAFHCVAFALVDPEFAKEQLVLLTREWYMHPNGQLPAYEWNFGDVNPPVHAWAAWRVFEIDRQRTGLPGDLDFLKRVFHKLLLNFTWWVNRKDSQGRNIFQGGFLGLDNIGLFNRSDPLPTGGFINQADGTAWMAMYCLNLMRIALELGQYDHVYEDLGTKFFEHFLYIADAMTHIGGKDARRVGLWDETDEFYYDELNLPDGTMMKLRLRTIVGLIPLFAVEVLEPSLLEKLPDFAGRLSWFLANRPELASLVSRWEECGKGERHLLSLLRGHRMKRLFVRMLDETEFLSDYGVRSMSKVHGVKPYVFDGSGHRVEVGYLPGESDSGLFGGNSNWRGPIWMPINYLIDESMRRFHLYYGDDFRIECPTRSGTFVSIAEAADELARRLTRIFLRGGDGRRPVFGSCEKCQTDPHFRDLLQFYEYFHGDTGRGLGASHQTGWSGLIASLLLPATCVPTPAGSQAVGGDAPAESS